MMNLRKRNYIKGDEKTEIMKLSSLMNTCKKMIEKYSKLENADKTALTNLKYAVTYARKAFENVIEGVDPKILEDIKSFVDKKEVMILDPNDARMIRARRDKENETIDLSQAEFLVMSTVVKECLCSKCSGTIENCHIKEIMMLREVSGAKEYIECPFSGKEIREVSNSVEQQKINM